MAVTINGTTGISGVDGSAATPALQGGDTNTGIVFGTDTVGVVTGGVQRTTVDSSGRLLVGVGSANANGGVLQLSGGITFPGTAVAATDVNTLDDYEEGTWTPSIGGNATYTSGRYGIYTKIGNVVACQFLIYINILGTGSTTTLSGFPFTAADPGNVQSGACSIFNSLAVNTTFLTCWILQNGTTMKFGGQASSGPTMSIDLAVFGNSTYIFGSITYRVA